MTRLLSQFLFVYSFLSLYGNNRQYNENYLMAFGRPWKTLYKAIFSEKFLETSRKNHYFMKKTKKSVDFLIIIHLTLKQLQKILIILKIPIKGYVK